jgi:hypothetical protein
MNCFNFIDWSSVTDQRNDKAKETQNDEGETKTILGFKGTALWPNCTKFVVKMMDFRELF